MQKRILISLFILSSQALGFQVTQGSSFAFADLLYWQLQEVGADNWAEIIAPAGNEQSIQVLGVPFDWDPGFRIGAGYRSETNHWDSVIYYTWYKTQGRDQVSATSGGVHSPNLGNFFVGDTDATGLSGPYYKSAGIEWNFLFNTFDWELGRTFYFEKKYTLRPSIGLKAAIIDQAINSNWVDPIGNLPPTPFTSATEDLDNNFWGLGPSLGLNASWILYHSSNHALSLVGDFSGAFLWGQWQFSDVYHNDEPVTISINSDSMSTASTMGRGYIGLNWEGVIKKANLNIRLGYESQVWLNQLRFYSFNMGRQNNPLYLQGGVFDFCIHF